MTELGNALKEARLAKGLSLDDLQTITKIQKRYLQGIEEGNYESMPGKFYVRAFIKQYAEAVGLEPEVLFEEYKNDIPSIAVDELPGQLSRVKTRKTISDTGSKVLNILPKVFIGAFIIGAFVFVWYLAQKYAGDSAEEKTPNENKQEVTYEESEDLSKAEEVEKEKEAAEDKAKEEKAKEDETEKDPEPEDPVAKQTITVTQAQGDESSYELKDTDKFELKLVSTGDTWVNVKNSTGTSLFQGMLKKGGTESQVLDLTQETDITIVVGNTTATEIYVNDQKLEYAVSPSDVVKQDILIHYVKVES